MVVERALEIAGACCSMSMFVGTLIVGTIGVKFYKQLYLRIIQGWLDRQSNYTIRSIEPHAFGAPWGLFYSLGRPTYRVVLERRDGTLRNAWILAGGIPWGPYAWKLEVLWDDDSKAEFWDGQKML